MMNEKGATYIEYAIAAAVLVVIFILAGNMLIDEGVRHRETGDRGFAERGIESSGRVVPGCAMLGPDECY